jgi:hypothetical protein
MSHPFPFRKVYGAASLIAALTLFGLLSALLGDGVWDALSWVTLVIPLAVIVWMYTRAPKASSHRGRRL